MKYKKINTAISVAFALLISAPGVLTLAGMAYVFLTDPPKEITMHDIKVWVWYAIQSILLVAYSAVLVTFHFIKPSAIDEKLPNQAL